MTSCGSFDRCVIAAIWYQIAALRHTGRVEQGRSGTGNFPSLNWNTRVADQAPKKKRSKSLVRDLFSLLLLPLIILALPFIIVFYLGRALLIAIGLIKAPIHVRMTAKPREPRYKPTRPWHKIDSKHKSVPAAANTVVEQKPYAFAVCVGPDGFFDGRVGEKPDRLRKYGLPLFATPEDLAAWLKLPVKKLAWLADYHGSNGSESVQKKRHYHYQWIKKKSGGDRLIEAPKPLLKTIQRRIVDEILNRVPPHPAAHAFTPGKSIRTNAAPHCGKYIVIKADLANFFPSITTKRVAAIFRGIGYNVEMAHWLARLCTNRTPFDVINKHPYEFSTYERRHTPQGAPTSPALANLAAWGLDCRLAGLAHKWGMAYTRYADDLTFSAPEESIKGKSLHWFVRYLKGIIRDEKFGWRGSKLKIIRKGGRQTVTGLAVNVKPNIVRKDFDRLKAILTNCAKLGPATQNREKVENFKAHLEGRIGFVHSINAAKGIKLKEIFATIKW
jgi:RNA-directed DNA polymerase